MTCAELEPPCYGDYPDIPERLYRAVMDYRDEYTAQGGGWATAMPVVENISPARMARAMTCLLFCPRRSGCYNLRFTPQGDLGL